MGIYDVIVCTLLSAGGVGLGVEPTTKFSKRKGGLGRTSIFTRGLLGKKEVTFIKGGGEVAIFTYKMDCTKI